MGEFNVKGFKNMIPRVARQLLPPSHAEMAFNCRVQNGNLVPKMALQNVQRFSDGPFRTIFWLMRTYWLRWNAIVDVAKSFVLGDDTGRVFFTGTDVPRVTNVAMATTGSGTYPIASLKLGVPSPLGVVTVAQTFTGEVGGVVPYTLVFDGNSLSNFTLSDPLLVEKFDTFGNPAPSMGITNVGDVVNTFAPSYAYYDSDTGDFAFNGLKVDVYIMDDGQMIDIRFGCDANGKGVGLRLQLAAASGTPTGSVSFCNFTQWLSGVAQVITTTGATLALYDETWYTVEVMHQRSADGGYTGTWTVHAGGSLIASGVFSTNNIFGHHLGFWRLDQVLSGTNEAAVDNLSTYGSGASASDPANAPQISNYVFTYVNSLGNESAPSPFSADVVIDDNLSRSLTFPPVPNATDQAEYGAAYVADYAIIGRRLYRASGDPAVYLLIADELVLPNATTLYTDTTDDEDLGVELPSEGWDLPDPAMINILALPNGIMAGSVGNQLCLSAQGFPHAWPDNYRLPTDAPIVALGNIDSTVVVLTDSFPYLASGTDPGNYGMAKLERSYGCVSKRSVVYLRNVGVVFATTDGLVAIVGAAEQLITREYFTQAEWMLLNPGSIIAGTKDDRYVGFCQFSPGLWRGFEFDPSPGGNGFIWVDETPTFSGQALHPEGFFLDDMTGNLYMIRSDWLGLYEGAVKRATMRWKGRVEESAYALALMAGRLKPAPGYPGTGLTLRLYADDALIFTKAITSKREFVMPDVAAEDHQVEIEGNWPVEQVSGTTTMDRLP